MSDEDKSPYLWVGREAAKSPAFVDLSFSARLVYVYFRAKIKVRPRKGVRKKAIDRQDPYEPINNGELQFSYQEAKTLGFSSATFSKALTDLQSHGFIRLEKRGYGGGGSFSVPSEYRIIEDWKDWKKPEQDQKQRGLTAPTRSRRATPLLPPPQEQVHGTD